jgi:hypothetical protein
MRIDGLNLAVANFSFQVSFGASLSLPKVQQRVLRKVRAEEKERRFPSSLTTQSSSSNQRKTRRREKEEKR